MAAHDLLGQPQLAPHLPHFVLEQLAQRLDQLPGQIGPQAAHVVMRLDRHPWPAARRRRLDHVGVERPPDEESYITPYVPRPVLEHVAESVTDAAPPFLGVLDARQRRA